MAARYRREEGSPVTGLLAESRSAWTALYPGLLLGEKERAARTVECANCGAAIDYACTAVTGLVASGPCDVRVRDAAAATESAA